MDPGEKGWACYYCGKKGHLKQDCPQASKLSLAPCPVCKGPHWRRDCPLRWGPRGFTLRTLRTEGARGSPQTPILITPEEPQVLITVGANQSIFFWTLGQLSLCTLKPLVCFLPIHYHNGTVWMSLTLLFQPSIKLQLGLCAFFFFFFLSL